MHAFAVLTAAMTFLLLIAGGLVTSTDSGLSVPDWPLSYGQLMPPMVGGIRYEHSHRMIAAIVGLLITALALWLWRRESRAWVRRLGAASLAAVVTQALLGGLTVLWVLPAPVSIAHACLGQLVFCLVVSIAVALSPSWTRASSIEIPSALRRISALAFGALAVQLALGALIRHSGRALALHLLWAIVPAALAVMAWRCARQQPTPAPVRRLAHWLLWGVAGQVALGVQTWASRQHPLIATAHVGLGAALLACSWVMVMWAMRSRKCQTLLKAKVSDTFADYLALTKPRLTGLAMISVGVGFLMGSREFVDWLRLMAVVLGAGLVGGGANAWNQWMERDADALMSRTADRPLPAGRLSPGDALAFATTLTAVGLVVLLASANGLAAWLALATVVSYVGVYTPLKRVTSLCTPVGAIPGALPPLVGWAAAAGVLTLEAWVLFAMLFCWQLPHFLAIAWAHREDYARAGFRMLPVVDQDGASTSRQMVLYGLALLPISLLPTLLGITGAWYFLGAAGLGVWFVWMAISAARTRTPATAHRLFLASVSYLPAVLALMVLDKRPI